MLTYAPQTVGSALHVRKERAGFSSLKVYGARIGAHLCEDAP